MKIELDVKKEDVVNNAKFAYGVVKEFLVFLILLCTALTLPSVYIAARGMAIAQTIALNMMGVPFP